VNNLVRYLSQYKSGISLFFLFYLVHRFKCNREHKPIGIKMKKTTLLSILSLFILSGCSSSGAFLSANQTIVNLNEGNYTITATNVMGESEAAYILGLSYSTGLTAATLAIARVEGSGMLYAEALENLWENFEAASSVQLLVKEYQLVTVMGL
jgi:hypothetical protein